MSRSRSPKPTAAPPPPYDALIIGAGMAGMYQLAGGATALYGME